MTFVGDSFSDVVPLSHEVAEWLNDPFVGAFAVGFLNFIPPATLPGQGGARIINFEVGDPLEALPTGPAADWKLLYDGDRVAEIGGTGMRRECMRTLRQTPFSDNPDAKSARLYRSDEASPTDNPCGWPSGRLST